MFCPSPRVLCGAVALAAVLFSAAAASARPPVGSYDCQAGVAVYAVTLLEEGCAIDGEAGAEAGGAPVVCDLAPPVIRAITMFDDLTFLYTETDLQGATLAQASGVCVMR